MHQCCKPSQISVRNPCPVCSECCHCPAVPVSFCLFMCRVRLLTPPKDNFLKPDGHYLLAGLTSNPGAQTCKLLRGGFCCDTIAGQGLPVACIRAFSSTRRILVSINAVAHASSKGAC